MFSIKRGATTRRGQKTKFEYENEGEHSYRTWPQQGGY